MITDQRRHLRLPLHSRVFIELQSPMADHCEQGIIVQCNTLEVSRGGLSVSLNERLTPSAILQIGVELAATDEPAYLAAQVKWCEPMPGDDSRWCAGFAIIDGNNTDFSLWQSMLIEMDG